MYFGWQGLKDCSPNGTDHDSGINGVVRPPALSEIVGAQAWVGRLQRLGYGNQKSRAFRLVCLGMKVEEPADEINLIHWTAISVLMIAAIQHDLQLVPGGCEILVGQGVTAYSIWSIRDICCCRRGLCRNGVAPCTGIRNRPKELTSAPLEPKLLHHLPGLYELPQLGLVHLVSQFR